MTNYATNLVEDLRLLEAPAQIPWAAILGAVVLAIVLGLVLARLLGRRGHADGGALGDQEVDPSIEALGALRSLTGLMSPEQSREFAIEVTAIIRLFLERRFGLRAAQRATEEFLREAARSTELASAQRGLLENFLRTCEAMKFGRTEGSAEDLKAVHEAAIRFVEASRGMPLRKEVRP